MFQTSELGFNTMKEAKAAGIDTSCHPEDWLKGGVFLVNKHYA